MSVNLFGCVAFGISAVADYVKPSTDQLVKATVTNANCHADQPASIVVDGFTFQRPLG